MKIESSRKLEIVIRKFIVMRILHHAKSVKTYWTVFFQLDVDLRGICLLSGTSKMEFVARGISADTDTCRAVKTA